MNLDELRRKIDEIDGEIVGLLNERLRNALQIGKEKEKEGIVAHDPAREDEVLSRVQELNGGPLSEEAVKAIYSQIISACREAQEGVDQA